MTHVLVHTVSGVVTEALIGTEAGLKGLVQERYPWLDDSYWQDFGYTTGVVVEGGLHNYQLFTVRKWYAKDSEEEAVAHSGKQGTG